MTTSVLAEMTAADSSIEMMIGIGLVKETDAVFFQYLGEEQKPSALMMPSGKPLTRLANVKLAELSIAENIGEFKMMKLNIILETTAGRKVMLTSGLTTLWSQFLLAGLSGLAQTYSLDQAFTLDTWKGTSAMRPCFAAVRQAGNKVNDMMLKEQLQEARADRDNKKVETIIRDTVEILNHSLKGDAPLPVSVTVADDKVNEVVTDLF